MKPSVCRCEKKWGESITISRIDLRIALESNLVVTVGCSEVIPL